MQNLAASYDIEVPARTLTSILDDLAGERVIDFISLDVEGYEVEVFKGLNLSRHTPKFILVETSNFEAISAILGTHYDCVEQLTVHDYLFQLRSSGSTSDSTPS